MSRFIPIYQRIQAQIVIGKAGYYPLRSLDSHLVISFLAPLRNCIIDYSVYGVEKQEIAPVTHHETRWLYWEYRVKC
jgi:hypothetical protein